MDVHLLARQLDAMRQHVMALSAAAEAPPGARSHDLEAAVETLSTTLEELQAAEHHLREQNERILSSQGQHERERQRYKELFDLAPDGYVTTDLAGTIREANQAAVRLLGTPGRFLVGWPLITFLPPSERGRFLEELSRLRKNAAGPRECEIHLERTDEPAVTLACTVAVSREADGHGAGQGDGRLVGFRWLLRDVSERKRAEEALRREKDFAEGLIRTARAAVLVLSAEGRILRTNPLLQDLTGHSAAELEGQDWLSLLVPPDDHPRLTELVRALQEGRPAVAEQARLRARDGGERTLHWTGSTLRHPGGLSVLLVGHDVTELQEAQRRALQAERLAAIGQMVTGLAHESHNALQRSHACLEMLTLELRDNPRALELIGRVRDAQAHLTRLYEEVRQFATPVRLERRSCRLPDVWRRAWEVLEHERAGQQTVLREEGCGGDMYGHFDPLRLQQVFRNIFENSLAVCHDPVEIMVACEPVLKEGRPAVQVSVRDNGPGLGEEQRRRIFEPFYTTKTKGTGLGMAISRSIVEAHDGAIFAGDASLGAEILILLPLGE